jgi:hypothetical protein
MWPPLIVERDHLAVDSRLERAGAPARADVLAHQRVLRVQRHVADVAVPRCTPAILQHVPGRQR